MKSGRSLISILMIASISAQSTRSSADKVAHSLSKLCIYQILSPQEPIHNAEQTKSQETPSPLGSIIMDQIMKIWLLINLAQTIQQNDSHSYHEKLYEEFLLLHAELYHAFRMNALTLEDQSIISEALSALDRAKTSLALSQTCSEDTCIELIMQKIMHYLRRM